MAKKPMSAGKIVLIVIIAILVLGVLWFVSAYNGLVSMDESVNQKWNNVLTVYQRRADLIPNLVETVQGAANYESETQTKIAALRTQAVAVKSALQSADTPEKLDALGAQLDSLAAGFNGLNINVERYPDLKVPANFQSLQDELANTENKIAVERMRYNEAVKTYNTKIRSIPTVIIANMFGFESREGFSAEEGAEQAPDVKF